MKKLMIAMAIAASTVVASAANVSWSLSNFYVPKASKAGAMTVKETENSTGTKAINGQIAFELFVIDYSSGSAGAKTLLDKATVTFTEAGKMATATLWNEDTAISMRDTYGNSGTVYLELVGKYSDANYDYVYVSDVSKSLTNIKSGGQTYTFTGTKASAWTATAAPEPTSGLLLLLGLAGMALKRKHA